MNLNPQRTRMRYSPWYGCLAAIERDGVLDQLHTLRPAQCSRPPADPDRQPRGAVSPAAREYIKVSIPRGLVNEEHPFHLHSVGSLCRMARVVVVLMRIPSSLLARLLRGSQCRHHRVQQCEPRQAEQAEQGQHWPCGRQRHNCFVVSPLRVFSSCLSVI